MLSPLELNPQNPLRRESPRPQYLRGPGYQEQFDDLTVFYDCFRTADGRGTIMLGPPLLNLERPVWRALRGSDWRRRFLPMPVRRLDRHSQVRIGTAGGIDLPAGMFQQSCLRVRPNCSEIFRGRRVVLAMSRDNELQWIKDWVLFVVRNHGADAVLLYDNASTKYGSEQLRETIHSVPGVAAAEVVEWPYKHGPRGAEGVPWDSDFCQYGAMEHARHRFLAHAQAVVNSDIDEFPIAAGGELLFALALRCDTGYLVYGGHWIENASRSPAAETANRRHKHYAYRSRSPRAAERKWTVVPARCPADAQWLVHFVAMMPPDPLSSLVHLRHFRAINTNWREHRWQPEVPNERDHVVDEELVKSLRVFDAEQ